jgi:hypothetical protein
MKNIAYVMLLLVFVVTIGLNTSTYAQGPSARDRWVDREVREEKREARQNELNRERQRQEQSERARDRWVDREVREEQREFGQRARDAVRQPAQQPATQRDFTGLNRSEKFLALESPGWVTSRVGVNAYKAGTEAQNRFPESARIQGSSGDAFRHTYWSALLARDLGPAYAKRFTDAHENVERNPPDSKSMDLYNNMIGIQIGYANRTASDQELADLCERALRAGMLVVLRR